MFLKLISESLEPAYFPRLEILKFAEGLVNRMVTKQRVGQSWDSP